MTDFDVETSGFADAIEDIEEFEQKWTTETGYLLGTGAFGAPPPTRVTPCAAVQTRQA